MWSCIRRAVGSPAESSGLSLAVKRRMLISARELGNPCTGTVTVEVGIGVSGSGKGDRFVYRRQSKQWHWSRYYPSLAVVTGGQMAAVLLVVAFFQ